MAYKLKPGNIKRFFLQLAGISLLTALDLIIKYFMELNLPMAGKITLIPGILGLRYTRNTGAAFGSMSGMTQLLSVFTGIIIIGMLVFLFIDKTGDKVYHIIIPLIAAGGLGNLADRVFRGYVVDYLEFLFIDFAIFNFADCLVTCGAIFMIVYLIYSQIKEAKQPGKVAENGEA